MPKSMHNVWPSIEKELHLLSQMGIPVIPLYREKIKFFQSVVNSCALITDLAMNLIYIHLGVTRGVPCYHFPSSVKSSPYIGKIPLYRERITSIAPKVNPCAFITELTMILHSWGSSEWSVKLSMSWIWISKGSSYKLTRRITVHLSKAAWSLVQSWCIVICVAIV